MRSIRCRADGGAVFIDMANDAAVRAAVHHHYGEGLRYDCAVGLTHWERDPEGGTAASPGAAPEVFFAPARIKQRVRDWGPRRIRSALRGRMATAPRRPARP